MGWHNDDDNVKNDSVGWMDPSDYQQEERAPERQPRTGPNPWWSEPAQRPRPRFYEGRD